MLNQPPFIFSSESTPGSPYSFPSPVTTSIGPLTPTSSTRGGLTSKRRGRPPKQNGSLGRGFPPPTQTGDKHRLSEDQIQVTDKWIIIYLDLGRFYHITSFFLRIFTYVFFSFKPPIWDCEGGGVVTLLNSHLNSK